MTAQADPDLESLELLQLTLAEHQGLQAEPLEGDAEPLAETFACTDAGNAELFACLYGNDLRFDHKGRRWLVWAGHWWREDTMETVVQLAKNAARYRYRQAESCRDLETRKSLAKWAIQSEQRTRIEACLSLARSERPLADDGEGWDADQWLLAVANGVIDLRTGEFRPGRREDWITKHSPVAYDPQASCPRFEAFLEKVQPAPELRAYLQRRAGYALTGRTTEQDLVFNYGAGANGKTTFMNALMQTLGPDYAKQAAPRLLMRTNDRHPTEIADLDGVRLVVSTEVEEGRVLAEELVKQLTGGDRIRARRMRQDFYEFDGTFKIMLLANHKPEVRGEDHGIWRRIKLLPWLVTVPPSERDPNLPDQLKQEARGILNWMLEGCAKWQIDGMCEPQAVMEATDIYRTESNPLAEFLAERCELNSGLTVRAAEVFAAYRDWARGQGLGHQETVSSTKFGRLMGERFESGHDNKGKFYRGVGLLFAGLPVTGSRAAFESDVTGSASDPVKPICELSHGVNTETPVNPSLPVTGSADQAEKRGKEIRI